MSGKDVPVQTSTFTGPIIVLVGPAGSGKSTLADILAPPSSDARIKSITTRKPRSYENAQTSDHAFVSDEKFAWHRNFGSIICVREFTMGDKTKVYYGIDKGAVSKDTASPYKVVVLDPDGAKEFKAAYHDQAKIFYLTNESRDDRICRLIQRGDDIADIRKRLACDSVDFAFYSDWDRVTNSSLFNLKSNSGRLTTI